MNTTNPNIGYNTKV